MTAAAISIRRVLITKNGQPATNKGREEPSEQ